MGHDDPDSLHLDQENSFLGLTAVQSPRLLDFVRRHEQFAVYGIASQDTPARSSELESYLDHSTIFERAPSRCIRISRLPPLILASF
jgi:hypothetical protein